MLVHAVVVLVQGEGRFVAPLRRCVVSLHLVEKADLEQGVDLPFDCERARNDRVLEVVDGLVDLVGLGKDGSQLKQNLRLLVEVR